MKRILLIIAIAGMSFGCEAQDLGFYGTVADYPSINPNDSVPYLQLSKSDETVITLEKLLLYAQECWNDSMRQVEIGMNGRGVFYIHRKPTFEGFIEYLKSK